jgi:hypothetical protein
VIGSLLPLISSLRACGLAETAGLAGAAIQTDTHSAAISVNPQIASRGTLVSKKRIGASGQRLDKGFRRLD